MFDDSSPIDPPHFGLSDPERKVSEPILLYRGFLTGRWHDTEAIYEAYKGQPREKIQGVVNRLLDGIEGESEVSFSLSPTPHISWLFRTNYWPHSAGWPVLVPPAELSSEFATRAGAKLFPKPFVSEVMSLGHSRVMFPVKIGAPDSKLDEVRFYLVNFQVIQLVESVRRGGQSDPEARLRLRANGWRVEIERRPDLPQAINHLEGQRGYAVTHTCRMWREDNKKATQSTFTFANAESTLEAVQLFASFVRGGMVGVALPVGYRKGISKFEQWSVTSTDPGRYPDPHSNRPYPGWYLWWDYPPANRKAANWLSPMFDRFAAKWWHPDPHLQKLWRNVFRGLIHTYTDAERMDQSRAIVPACTALETLAWAILVVSEKWLTGEKQPDGGSGGYERLTAADHLRLLLRWAGLPTEVPASLCGLRKIVQGRGNWDGPQTVTWVRNRVVHPDRRDQLVDGISAESWLLAMWYTELVILKLLDYDGYFRDRLDGEKIKRVPWASASSEPE